MRNAHRVLQPVTLRREDEILGKRVGNRRFCIYRHGPDPDPRTVAIDIGGREIDEVSSVWYRHPGLIFPLPDLVSRLRSVEPDNPSFLSINDIENPSVQILRGEKRRYDEIIADPVAVGRKRPPAEYYRHRRRTRIETQVFKGSAAGIPGLIRRGDLVTIVAVR